MEGMFYNCSSLISPNLYNFHLNKVINIIIYERFK